jgi:hypothetical protein
MSDGNSTHPSALTEALLENEIAKDEDKPMGPVLVWGLALVGLALILCCFSGVALFLIQRRKRRNIVPQGSTRNSGSPHDEEATVCDEESLGEEKGQAAVTL